MFLKPEGQASADVRVYLLTYRRSHLLPRALDSLRAQTHANWICEVHNDDPDDPVPGEIVARAGDPRLIYVRHERNLGPTATFNQAYRPVPEPFVAILEDDNWWEPAMLSRLLAAIAPYPDVNAAWVNSRLWREDDRGQWQADGTIWPVDGHPPVTLFTPPDPRQACRSLQSHGAMLLRNNADTMVPCPEGMPIFAIEFVRERLYPGRLLLVREPLANFALTLQTWRRETADENMQVLALLARSFLTDSNFPDAFLSEMWQACSGSRGHTQRAVLVGAWQAGRLGRVAANANAKDLAMVAAWALRHPARFARLFRASRRFPDLYARLQTAACERRAEWARA